MSESRFELLTRPGCGLCEEAAVLLRELGVAFELIDVESDAGLETRYGELIPVLLSDGQPIAQAPIDEATLRAALKGVAPAPKPSR